MTYRVWPRRSGSRSRGRGSRGRGRSSVAIDLPWPLVVKPAIKEHFFYATRVKAWRADDRDATA